MKVAFVFILLALLALPTSAQTSTPEGTTCPALVESALQLTEDNCQEIGQNRVCYGNTTLEATSRPGLPDFSFAAPGDIAEVIDLESLSLSPMDTLRGVWGVIVMQIEASIDPTAREDVTFVVFGDTELQAAVPLVNLTVTEGANIRAEPSTDAAVLTSAVVDDTLIATGRTEDDSWLRVQLPEDQAGTGWISAEVVEADGDIDGLSAVDPAAENTAEALTAFGPMQAFYFESGRDDAPCEEAPNSGLLIQTPEGAASVTLWVDEVIIELDATTFVQAQPNGDLTVNVLEGSAQITAEGVTQTAVAGTQVNVPLDENLTAADVPSEPEPYDESTVQSLPTDLLPREVEIAEPLQADAGLPTAGDWLFAWGVDERVCDDGTVVPFESEGVPGSLTVEDGSIVWGGGVYAQQAPGVFSRSYVDADANLHQDTLSVVSPGQIQGEAVIDLASTVCTVTAPFALTLVE